MRTWPCPMTGGAPFGASRCDCTAHPAMAPRLIRERAFVHRQFAERDRHAGGSRLDFADRQTRSVDAERGQDPPCPCCGVGPRACPVGTSKCRSLACLAGGPASGCCIQRVWVLGPCCPLRVTLTERVDLLRGNQNPTADSNATQASSTDLPIHRVEMNAEHQCCFPPCQQSRQHHLRAHVIRTQGCFAISGQDRGRLWRTIRAAFHQASPMPGYSMTG
jgi:hypothetical protein